ncbi:MAG: DUF448 domain-containing protein [Sphingomonadales bacterium]|jgi:predicted RNA-binding protein YlxR (DUF448 family)/ribosomal protein L7Ae-like RNA K-turn-binding protein
MKKLSTTRACFLTGEERPKVEMVRFVIGPESFVFPDLWGKLPGRGAWLKADKELLQTSLKNGKFEKEISRSLKEKVIMQENIKGFVVGIEKALVKRCCELLGLEKRAGRLITGFEKVSSALKNKTLGFLIEADDAGLDGADKLKNLAQYHKGQVLFTNVLSRDELSTALGKENVVHVGILLRGISTRMKEEALRLTSFRGKSVQVLGSKI